MSNRIYSTDAHRQLISKVCQHLLAICCPFPYRYYPKVYQCHWFSKRTIFSPSLACLPIENTKLITQLTHVTKTSSLQNRSHILPMRQQHAHNVHCNNHWPPTIPKVLLPAMQAHSLSQQTEKAQVKLFKSEILLLQSLRILRRQAQALIAAE